MRFAQKGEVGRSYITQFVDISMTGLAFITDRETAPFLFEMIKIEIPLDNNQQIAWWAKVVRVEEYADHKWYLKKAEEMDESKVLVAVHYHDLPLGHREKIKLTLEKKFVELESERRAERFKTLASLWSHYTWQIFLYGALIASTIWVLWFLSQPGANYDAEKGAPWGQRFEGWLRSGTPRSLPPSLEEVETGVRPNQKPKSPETE